MPPRNPDRGNKCNSLCRALVTNLQLVHDLNAVGDNVQLHLEFMEPPSTSATSITVISVDLNRCEIRGIIENGTNVGQLKIVNCSFAFDNYVDLQIN